MRISDWSSDVCSSDLRLQQEPLVYLVIGPVVGPQRAGPVGFVLVGDLRDPGAGVGEIAVQLERHLTGTEAGPEDLGVQPRSEERRVGKECVRTWRSRWRPNN